MPFDPSALLLRSEVSLLSANMHNRFGLSPLARPSSSPRSGSVSRSARTVHTASTVDWVSQVFHLLVRLFPLPCRTIGERHSFSVYLRSRLAVQS